MEQKYQTKKTTKSKDINTNAKKTTISIRRVVAL